MKRVLIVEDEEVVREKIVRTIKWSEEVVLAGAVESGAEALKVCEEVMPEIAFIDIQMPVMDGITLTERLKEKIPHLKVVLLTAYSEFSYARRGIELNVEKYILKYELNEGMLNQILQELSRKIDGENEKVEKQEVLKRLLFEQLTMEKCIDIMDKAGIYWPQSRVYLCWLNCASQEEINRICSHWKTAGIKTECCWVSETAAVLFCSRKQGIRGEIQSKIKMQAEADKDILFIDSEKEVEAWHIHEIFKKMFKVNEMFLFFGESNLISMRLTEFITPFQFQDDLTYIRNELKQRQYDTAVKRIRFLLENKAMRSCNKDALEECLDQLIGEIYEEVSRHDTTISHSWALDMFKRIRACRNMKQIVEIMTEELDKMKKAANMSRKMYQILNYLDEHYMEDLTQEELARRFDWNPSYLSQMFRKELGITYKDYINERKLKKAKELLEEGKLSVEQIAELTGFKSANYFYKIFKKKTGMKPREY